MNKQRIAIAVALMLLTGCATSVKVKERVNIVDPTKYNDCGTGHIRVRQDGGEPRCVVERTLCTGPYTITVYPDGDYICEYNQALARKYNVDQSMRKTASSLSLVVTYLLYGVLFR